MTKRVNPPRWLKDEIYKRCNRQCELKLQNICQEVATQIHHKIEVKDGGQNTLENLLAVCFACHESIHNIKRKMPKFVPEEFDFDWVVEKYREL